jgi:uncharacterized Zn finger protein (UPF0148 family)
MSEPEIARRCSSCGASIREGAFFCPQCGKELARQLREKEKPDSATTAPLVDVSPEKDTSSVDGPTVHSDTAPLEPSKKEAASSPLQSPAVRPASLGKVRGKIQRATTIARDVEGDVIHRVQKVREISSVVLDEAGYDPSLRFVLVAAALFGLFLLILLLNKLIG